MNNVKNVLGILCLLFCVSACDFAAKEELLREASVSECLPREDDYTFMWWAHGFLNEPNNPPMQGRRVLCVQTGQYAFAMDCERVEITHFGSISDAVSYEEVLKQSNDFVFSQPRAGLHLAVRDGDKEYVCKRQRGEMDIHKRLEIPYRIIESGKFLQRFDILDLVFEDAQGNELEAQTRLEVVAWPDRLTLVLEIAAKGACSDVGLEMSLDGKGLRKQVQANHAVASLQQNEKARVVLNVPIIGSSANEEGVTLTAKDFRQDDYLRAEYDPKLAAYVVQMLPAAWNPGHDLHHMDRIAVHLENHSNEELIVPVHFAMDEFPYGNVINGTVPMLRDAQGHPTGHGVQLSKNWHKGFFPKMLYDSEWSHSSTVVRLPARSRMKYEFTQVSGMWGNVPAASHAHLSLIGWGGNQVWDQVAIGNWGESICYDVDVVLRRSMIDDMRPLMVTSMSEESEKWNWTNNVGGGDFLVYFDETGQKHFLTRMRTYRKSIGPNLTDVTYAGVTLDGCIRAKLNVKTPRVDDVMRAYHTVRYDVQKEMPFTRLAFYQLGADHYHDHEYEKLAWGNADGLIEEIDTPKGGLKYHVREMECVGDAFWFSMHEGVKKEKAVGAWANRGLIIRNWKARLGGKDVPNPVAAFYGTENGYPSCNVELVPPADVNCLLPGDFVEAQVHVLVLPQFAEDYYGPNEELREALKENGNSWQLVHREAKGNDLAVEVVKGKLLQKYPLVIEVDRNENAEFSVAGGVGFVPVTFKGLRDYCGYQLRVNGEIIDQSRFGNDFWQMDYSHADDTWSRTYNVKMNDMLEKDKQKHFKFISMKRTEGQSCILDASGGNSKMSNRSFMNI